MERKLNIKVLLPEDVIEKYDIDEDTGVLSYFEDGAIHILIEDDDEMPEEEMHDTVCDDYRQRHAYRAGTPARQYPYYGNQESRCG